MVRCDVKKMWGQYIRPVSPRRRLRARARTQASPAQTSPEFFPTGQMGGEVREARGRSEELVIDPVVRTRMLGNLHSRVDQCGPLDRAVRIDRDDADFDDAMDLRAEAGRLEIDKGKFH